jgi:PTH2 family peptidyl-tRNA hydrolase
MQALTFAIMEFKQCIVIREDLKLSSGKLAVQVAHAAILAMERAEKNVVRDWKEEGQRKIVLKVPTLQDLFRLREDAERANVACAIVIDAGLTEIPPGTATALGLGPARATMLDKITGKLKLV